MFALSPCQSDCFFIIQVIFKPIMGRDWAIFTFILPNEILASWINVLY